MTALRIIVKGIVQGVGFRPFIYQLAHKNNINGWVLNSSEGVIIEAEGSAEAVGAFVDGIKREAPPRSVIESIETEDIKPQDFKDFTIKKSVEKPDEFQLVSPDIAVCDECLEEMFDPTDRRFRYPFINCTNCGPRFTIIKDIPYDRPKTTMYKFTMCPDCQAEYDDPTNRRFHAQPNACPVCGPEVEYHIAQKNRSAEAQKSGGGKEQKNGGISVQKTATKADAVKATVRDLKDGKVVAIKGLGGFHLACDAANADAVHTLRVRKRRYGKPLAIMVKDAARAAELCEVNDKERELLESPRRPIVLLKKKEAAETLAGELAPNNNYLGIMLPYTPLHYILLSDTGLDLVMTSGNLSEEPIAAENEEAFRRLGHIADSFLVNDRDIYSRYDDSVVRVIGGREVMVRRARSYAPYPVTLPFKVEREVLAVGGELKSTFCLLKDKYAFVSQHIGDMENAETFEHYENTVELYEKLFRVKPEIVAHDLHPDYFSTRYARSIPDVRLVGVQHHHAHIVSCMVENGVDKRVIGVSFDGTGYGTDGTVWGGEFLVSDLKDFERAGYLRTVRLPGGEVAIKKPYRTAFSYVYSFFPAEYENLAREFLKRLDSVEIDILIKQVETGLLSPMTSSAGRFFDAASSLMGIRDEIDYEGQAAIEMEMAADENTTASYAFDLSTTYPTHNSQLATHDVVVVDTQSIIRGILEDVNSGVGTPVMAAKFHNTIVELIIAVCGRLKEQYHCSTVALAGGVFQNALLSTRTVSRLKEEGFKVLEHSQVPTNDGGISLGQAVVGYLKG
ncbi:MAG: carbamoyltransferase HypF [Bacteroidetes bacterium]|nr:carbamoyltransferase HypF [Bacteroidota bacterium]